MGVLLLSLLIGYIACLWPIDWLQLRGAEAAEKDQKAGISEDIVISDSFLTEL